MAAVAINGKIYAMGGLQDSVGVTYITEEYDVASNKWKKVAYSGTEREGHTASVVNNKIYTIGGWDRYSNLEEVVEEFIP